MNNNNMNDNVNNNMNNNNANNKLIILILAALVIGLTAYICGINGIFNFNSKNEKSNLNQDNNVNNGVENNENTVNDTSVNNSLNKYSFEFKNRCDDPNANGDSYVNIYSENGTFVKKIDGYQTYEEKEMNGKIYYLLGQNYCTDNLLYSLVLDNNLNEVYNNGTFKFNKSNKYVVINKDNVVDLLDYNWKYVKSIEKNGNIRFVDNYYLKLEGNNYNIYDYDSNFIVTLFEKTGNEDIFSPFTTDGGIELHNINNQEILSIETSNDNDVRKIYYYNFGTKTVGTSTPEQFNTMIQK